MSLKFQAKFGMKNRHIQTLYSSFFRKTAQPKISIERFILQDSDFLDCYWHYITNSSANTPIVILFHGLAGSYKSPYIKGVMNELNDSGFNSVLMHFRGCSGEANKLPRSYHSGETADALEFITSIQKRFPNAKLYAVGYSLGGNMLLKLLGELKENSPFEAAVSVSAPLQLDICADSIKEGFSRIYQAHLMKALKKSLQQKYSQHDMHSLINFDEKEIKNLKTFWDFDGTYTAPVHGFESAQDYYEKSSSKQYLKDIHTNTLIIHSLDDPFMTKEVVPSSSELSESITLEVSAHGGHVGFIGGTFFHPEYWLEKRITKYISNIDKTLNVLLHNKD